MARGVDARRMPWAWLERRSGLGLSRKIEIVGYLPCRDSGSSYCGGRLPTPILQCKSVSERDGDV